MRMTKTKNKGFTLIELLVAMTLGLLIMLVMTQLFAGSKQTYLVQDGLTRVQEDGRLAMYFVSREIRKAGYRTPVWNEPASGYHPVTAASTDGANGGNDTLQIMYEDNISCVGVLNNAIDPETGEARALYKRLTFAVNNSGNLVWTCQYGASPGALATQISQQSIIDGVESFQVLYGVDTDFPPDFSVNSWASAGGIRPENTVCLQSSYLCEAESLLNTMQNGVPVVIKIGLLLASPGNAETEDLQTTFNVLDVQVTPAADRKLRKQFTSTVTIRNLTL